MLALRVCAMHQVVTRRHSPASRIIDQPPPPTNHRWCASLPNAAASRGHKPLSQLKVESRAQGSASSCARHSHWDWFSIPALVTLAGAGTDSGHYRDNATALEFRQDAESHGKVLLPHWSYRQSLGDLLRDNHGIASVSLCCFPSPPAP
jgi:hypothetical protein